MQLKSGSRGIQSSKAQLGNKGIGNKYKRKEGLGQKEAKENPSKGEKQERHRKETTLWSLR